MLGSLLFIVFFLALALAMRLFDSKTAKEVFLLSLDVPEVDALEKELLLVFRGEGAYLTFLPLLLIILCLEWLSLMIVTGIGSWESSWKLLFSAFS